MFYKIEVSLDLKEIGNYPQIQKYRKGYDTEKLESISRAGRFYNSEKPDVIFDFDCLELARHAKLTDYMSSSYLSDWTGLLVSEFLYNYFRQLRMSEYVTFPSSVYKKGELLSDNYVWMHYIRKYTDIINYKKSDFFLNHKDANYKKVSFKSYDEFIKAKEYYSYIIDSNKLVLKKEIVSQYDVLRIGVIKSETYITEAVKNEMVNSRFTGIVYEPADYLIVE